MSHTCVIIIVFLSLCQIQIFTINFLRMVLYQANDFVVKTRPKISRSLLTKQIISQNNNWKKKQNLILILFSFPFHQHAENVPFISKIIDPLIAATTINFIKMALFSARQYPDEDVPQYQ